MYEIEFPKQDIPAIQEWVAQKNSPNFHTFLAHVLEDMKFQVTEMHVKFERSNDPDQARIIEPIKLTESAEQTKLKVDDKPTENDMEAATSTKIRKSKIDRDKAEYFFERSTNTSIEDVHDTIADKNSIGFDGKHSAEDEGGSEHPHDLLRISYPESRNSRFSVDTT